MTRRIVITCWGSYGDVYPYVGLAKELQARGHATVVAAPSYYRQAVEQENIEFAAVGLEVEPDDRQTIARVMDPVKGPEAVIRDLVVPALRETYLQLENAAIGADVLVGHPLTYAVSALAEKRRVPWVSTLLAPLGFFSVTDLPVLPAAPWLEKLRWLGPWYGRLLVALLHRATESWVEPVYRLRAELGLPRGGHPVFEGQFSPALTLALFSRVLAETQPDWPPHTVVTGFVFYNGPGGLDPAIDEFLSTGPPPVVFTLGTSAVAAAGRFYEESISAVERLGIRALLLTGGFPENRPSGQPPTGVLFADRAPHQLLFPRASAVVHQGGIGTTAQALRSGHPMLVVPHAHDQPDNAFRVTRLGVARTVFPTEYRADRVVRELRELLNDRRYRDRSQETSDSVKREGGVVAAAEAIERLIA